VTWWAWTLLWVVLVVGAGLVLFLAARRLFRQGAALVRELGDAADLLTEVTRALDARPGEEPAVAAPAEPAGSPRRGRASTRASSSRRRRASRPQDVR
jgi:hypothetical protein